MSGQLSADDLSVDGTRLSPSLLPQLDSRSGEIPSILVNIHKGERRWTQLPGLRSGEILSMLDLAVKL